MLKILYNKNAYIYIHLLLDLCSLLTCTEDSISTWLCDYHSLGLYENSISVLCSSLYNQNPHECFECSTTTKPKQHKYACRQENLYFLYPCIEKCQLIQRLNTVNRPSTESLFWRREILFWFHCFIIILCRSAEIS